MFGFSFSLSSSLFPLLSFLFSLCSSFLVFLCLEVESGGSGLGVGIGGMGGFVIVVPIGRLGYERK